VPEEVRGGPVMVFCADLSELRRASGRSLAALAQELKMSRGHLYTILNGEVKRPPDWSRVVEPLLRACGADDATIALWRTRHGVLEEVYEQLRRHQPAAPGTTEPTADVPCPLPHRTRPSWRFRTAQVAALLLAAAAGAFVARLTAPDPSSPASAAPACADAELGTWWNNDPRVGDPGDDPKRFTVPVRGGTEDPWDLMVAHSCVDITQGRRYMLAFTAAASAPVTITVRVQDKQAPKYVASLDELVSLTAAPKRFQYQFTGGYTSVESELLFQVGGHAADFRVEVSGLSLTAL
jgi:transcriptional regulator with XRE-family HTH domain